MTYFHFLTEGGSRSCKRGLHLHHAHFVREGVLPERLAVERQQKRHVQGDKGSEKAVSGGTAAVTSGQRHENSGAGIRRHYEQN